MLEGELGGAADAVDAVVGLLGGEAAEGLEDVGVFFGDQIIGPGEREEGIGLGKQFLEVGDIMHILETHLTVEGSIAVPAGNGLQELGEPGALGDIAGEGWGRHFGWMCGG